MGGKSKSKRPLTAAERAERNAAIAAAKAAHLTNAQIATLTGLNPEYVKKLLGADGGELLSLANDAKEKAAQDINAFMGELLPEVKNIIQSVFGLLPEKLGECSAVQLMTVTGILIDKWTAPALRAGSSAEVEDLTPLAKLINDPAPAPVPGEPPPAAPDPQGGGTA